MSIKRRTRIAVIGEAGSGKDFIADLMVDYFGFTRYAFADEVRTVSERYFPKQYGTASKKNRKLLIDVGMAFRSVDSEVWVDEMLRQIGDDDMVIITDTRMPNEYTRLQREGFTFIRILAEPYIRNARIAARGDVVQPGVLNHETESYYDDFQCEFVINNNHNEKILAYAAVATLLEDKFGVECLI